MTRDRTCFPAAGQLGSILLALVIGCLPGVARGAALVEYFQTPGTSLNSMADADSLISAGSPSTVVHVDTVNFADTWDALPPAIQRGHFAGEALFPGVLPVVNDSTGDHFALRISGWISVPAAGDYTFGAVADDGLRLTIDGTTVLTVGPPSFENLGSATLSAGLHAFEATYFASIFADSLEIYSAAGAASEFSEDFRLLGDVANGGLAISVPEPATIVLGIIGGGAMVAVVLRRRQAIGRLTS